jgi:very-short-patch-repair endonuclease
VSGRTPKYEDVIAQMRDVYLQRADQSFRWEVDPLGSPIEKVLMATMLAHSWTPLTELGDHYIDVLFETLDGAGLTWPDLDISSGSHRFLSWLGGPTSCGTQCRIQLRDREIRPDFAFVHPGPHATKIIVELDGHDFHERTPDQAQSDKSRDRELQALGWHVMRFTGREVLRKPGECLQEVESLLIAKTALANAERRAMESKP